jgi:MoaA/NifB/PqqE/SkfB family radical SAM enzyme
VNRKKHESLSLDQVKDFLTNMYLMESKTVEWTGGGDPTQYTHINEVIILAASLGYRQGFITNGIDLKKNLNEEALRSLDWVRISMNALDYVEYIDLPEYSGTLGFSYVWNDDTDREVFEEIRRYADRYKPKYIRVVPDCQATFEEQIQHNASYPGKVALLGEPFFYQEKTFDKPDSCYWGYFKPFLLHDGWIYPCSSVVLNEDSERSFHEKYRWCRLEEIAYKWGNPMEPFNPQDCNHCVFCNQNKKVQSLIETNGMEDFI